MLIGRMFLRSREKFVLDLDVRKEGVLRGEKVCGGRWVLSCVCSGGGGEGWRMDADRLYGRVDFGAVENGGRSGILRMELFVVDATLSAPEGADLVDERLLFASSGDAGLIGRRYLSTRSLAETFAKQSCGDCFLVYGEDEEGCESEFVVTAGDVEEGAERRGRRRKRQKTCVE